MILQEERQRQRESVAREKNSKKQREERENKETKATQEVMSLLGKG